jgi:hypothetical protein
MLDIKPLPNDGRTYDCIKGLVASVGDWLGYGYELMSSNSWGFFIKPSNTLISSKIGGRVCSEIHRNYEMLKKYHGIDIELQKINNSPEILELLKGELKKGYPIIIGLDRFWCPWLIGYQKEHGFHAILVTGFDIDDNLWCIDYEPINYGQMLPLDHLNKGLINCFIFNIFDKPDIVDWRIILENAYLNLYSQNEVGNSFDSMMIFADFIENNLNYGEELDKGSGDLWTAPLFMDMLAICRGRYSFSITLDYLYKKYKVSDLLPLIDGLHYSGDGWYKVRALLIKAAVLKERNKILIRAAKNIRDLAEYEINLAELMIAIVNKNEIRVSIEECRSEFVIETSFSNIEEYRYIDISKYCNNQGFGNPISQQCTANLTGTGQFFLAENIPQDVMKVANMRFNLTSINVGINDNISCEGQKIELEMEDFNYIMLLGCSEYGDFSDIMTLEYIDSSSEDVLISFTNWTSKPLFAEEVAWNGIGMEKNNDEYSLMNFSVNLFAKMYHTNNKISLKSIRLPYCPNIHIFAISLGKGSCLK